RDGRRGLHDGEDPTPIDQSRQRYQSNPRRIVSPTGFHLPFDWSSSESICRLGRCGGTCRRETAHLAPARGLRNGAPSCAITPTPSLRGISWGLGNVLLGNL